MYPRHPLHRPSLSTGQLLYSRFSPFPPPLETHILIGRVIGLASVVKSRARLVEFLFGEVKEDAFLEP